MIIRFTASNLVAMILFIPILIALGLVLAIIHPALALIVAAAGIVFTGFYIKAKVGMVKHQPGKTQQKSIEVKDYIVR